MWSKVLLCILLELHILLAQDVGDTCIPNSNFAEGICSLVTDCDPAKKQIQIKRGHDFQRCGFEGVIEIVCCPRMTDSRFGSTTEKTSQPIKSQRIADQECQKILDSAIYALDLHILGGVDASLGEFPHMVALGFDRGNGYIFDCGGSVISKDFVLTAAHCIDTLDGVEPTIIRTGVVEIGGKTWDDESDVGIAEIIKHPGWSRKTKYHDLALLRLNKSLTFSSNLNAACLDTSDADPTGPLVITGWGQTSNTRDAKSTMLLKASVSAVQSAKCGESYNNWRKLPQGIVEKQLCAGDPKGIMDTCQGDSGGPLQTIINSDNVYRVVGITSFGRGCGSPVPGVYTRVAKYVDWIESVVWQQR